MSSSRQNICLLLDTATQSDSPVEITGDGMRYFMLSGVEQFGIHQQKLVRGAAEEPAIRLESMRRGQEQLLLMVAATELGPTINGVPAPHISTLTSGDVLTIGDHVLYVSLLNRPYVGPPESGHVGANCGFCRVAIADEPDMRVYVCPNCQLPTHFHAEEVPAERRLECAKLSPECGHCQAEIIQHEGFAYVPDL